MKILRIIFISSSLASVACHVQEPALASPQGVKVQLPNIQSTEGLPVALAAKQPVWESITGPRLRVPLSGSRLYENGEIWTWSPYTYEATSKGLPKRLSAPYRWRLSARVKNIGAIQQQVKKLFFVLPKSQATKVKSSTPAWRVWTAWHEGVKHQVYRQIGQEPKAVREIRNMVHRSIIPGSVPQ